MKRVYEAVSGVILPGMVFAFIMAIIAGAALLGRVGSRMEVQGEDFSQMADTKAVEAVCAREEPVIRYAGKDVWRRGEAVLISDTFPAEDAEGNPLPVQVLDITDQDGNSALDCYQETAHRAVFARRGVYTFSLKAMDGERKSGTKKCSILVDER